MSTTRPRSAWNAAKEARRAKRWDDPEVRARRAAHLDSKVREIEKRERAARTERNREILAQGMSPDRGQSVHRIAAATRRTA